MNRRRASGTAALRCVALVAATLTVAGCGAVVSRGSTRLSIEAPRWWFSRLPVPVVAEPAGILAGRDLTLHLFVGNKRVASHELAGKKARFWIPARALSPGANRILAKSGSVDATVEIRIVPIAALLWPLLLLAWLVAFVARSRQRQRAATRSGAAGAARAG